VKEKCFISGFKKSKDRKAIERENRDRLILTVAKQMLADGGLPSLSMQAIADHTEYSKGTIYQHYGCKEDVVARMVIDCGQNLVRCIEEALAKGNSPREKIVLVSSVFFMNRKNEPVLSPLVGNIQSADFKAKISRPLQDQIAQVDAQMLQSALQLFDGVAGFDEQKKLDATFGWWSMQWGVLDILVNQWDLDQLGFSDPEQRYFRNLHIYLDGLGLPADATCHDWQCLQSQAQKIIKNIQLNNEDQS